MQNTNGLDLGSDTLTTQELIYNCTKKEVDICCLVETNTNWKNKEAKEKHKQLLTMSWKLLLSVTLESKSKWSSSYKPGGTNTIIREQ